MNPVIHARDQPRISHSHLRRYPIHTNKIFSEFMEVTHMNTFKKIVSLMLALMVIMGCVSAVSAAPVAEATIDQSRKGSLTLYKYDLSATRS